MKKRGKKGPKSTSDAKVNRPAPSTSHPLDHDLTNETLSRLNKLAPAAKLDRIQNMNPETKAAMEQEVDKFGNELLYLCKNYPDAISLDILKKLIFSSSASHNPFKECQAFYRGDSNASGNFDITWNSQRTAAVNGSTTKGAAHSDGISQPKKYGNVNGDTAKAGNTKSSSTVPTETSRVFQDVKGTQVIVTPGGIQVSKSVASKKDALSKVESKLDKITSNKDDFILHLQGDGEIIQGNASHLERIINNLSRSQAKTSGVFPSKFKIRQHEHEPAKKKSDRNDSGTPPCRKIGASIQERIGHKISHCPKTFAEDVQNEYVKEVNKSGDEAKTRFASYLSESTKEWKIKHCSAGLISTGVVFSPSQPNKLIYYDKGTLPLLIRYIYEESYKFHEVKDYLYEILSRNNDEEEFLTHVQMAIENIVNSYREAIVKMIKEYYQRIKRNKGVAGNGAGGLNPAYFHYQIVHTIYEYFQRFEALSEKTLALLHSYQEICKPQNQYNQIDSLDFHRKLFADIVFMDSDIKAFADAMIRIFGEHKSFAKFYPSTAKILENFEHLLRLLLDSPSPQDQHDVEALEIDKDIKIPENITTAGITFETPLLQEEKTKQPPPSQSGKNGKVGNQAMNEVKPSEKQANQQKSSKKGKKESKAPPIETKTTTATATNNTASATTTPKDAPPVSSPPSQILSDNNEKKKQSNDVAFVEDVKKTEPVGSEKKKKKKKKGKKNRKDDNSDQNDEKSENSEINIKVFEQQLEEVLVPPVKLKPAFSLEWISSLKNKKRFGYDRKEMTSESLTFE